MTRSQTSFWPALAAALVTLGVALSLAARPLFAHAPPDDTFLPVTDAMLQDPSPDDWLMWRRTLDGWGYSPLDQIDRHTVDQIRMVWTRALSDGMQQGTPIAYNGVLYMPNPRDVIQAIDAVTGDFSTTRPTKSCVITAHDARTGVELWRRRLQDQSTYDP